MPSIALTGASGHLGFIIHKKLEEDDIQHRILLRHPVSYVNHEDFVVGDLSDTKVLDDLVKDCETVIHSAALIWPMKGRSEEVSDINFHSTVRLYEAALKAGVKHFIFISSIHSMEVPPENTVFDESAGLFDNEYYAYNHSKADAERYLAAQNGMKITVINPTAIIGPGDHYIRGLNQLFSKIERNKLPMLTEGGYDVVDVRDVADAIHNAYREQIEGKFILTSGYYSIKDLAEKYGRINGFKVPKSSLSAGQMKAVAAMARPIEKISGKPVSLNTYAVESLLEAHPNISGEKARRELGFSVTPIEITLRDTHEWMKYILKL